MSARNFDIVIANGRVIDPETGLDAIRHVGVQGGKIKAVSEKPLVGKTVISASGLVVAPGFIDLKCRAQSIPGDRFMAFDGVTTVLELETGAFSVGAWYAAQAQSGRALNYGVGVAWDLAYRAELNLEAGTSSCSSQETGQTGTLTHFATQEQMAGVLAQVEEGLQEGGIGISSDTILTTGAPEVAAALAAQYGVPFFSRIAPGSKQGMDSFFDSLIFMIGISAVTGTHIHLGHLNSTYPGDIERCLEVVKGAQRNGLRITLDAGLFGLASSIGDDPAQLPPYLFPTATDWTDHGEPTGNIQPDVQRSRQLLWAETGETQAQRKTQSKTSSLVQARIDPMVLFNGSAITSGDLPRKFLDGPLLDDHIWWLLDDLTESLCMSGPFAHFISNYVKKGKKISLMAAIEKCSFIPAKILEQSTPTLRRKGRLQAGADADIVVFDLEKFEDQATFESPSTSSTGVRHMLVNGTQLISDGDLDIMALPGRPVRRSII